MPDYAIIENNIITNIIVAQDIDTAQQFTDGIVLLCDNPLMVIGSELFENNWRLPKPYPSWVWNNNNWEAPVLEPEPLGCYYWSEDTQTWEQKEGDLIALKVKGFFGNGG